MLFFFPSKYNPCALDGVRKFWLLRLFFSRSRLILRLSIISSLFFSICNAIVLNHWGWDCNRSTSSIRHRRSIAYFSECRERHPVCAFWLHSFWEEALVQGGSSVLESEFSSSLPEEMSLSVSVKSKRPVSMFTSPSSNFACLLFLVVSNCFLLFFFYNWAFFFPVNASNYHFSRQSLVYRTCLFIFGNFQLLRATAECFLFAFASTDVK